MMNNDKVEKLLASKEEALAAITRIEDILFARESESEGLSDAELNQPISYAEATEGVRKSKMCLKILENVGGFKGKYRLQVKLRKWLRKYEDCL